MDIYVILIVMVSQVYTYVKAYQIVCFKSVQFIICQSHTYTERDRERGCVCVCVCVCVCERKTEPQRGRRMKGEVREGKRK